MKMAGILLIYILGIYFLLTKMMQLEDEAVVGVKKTHKELSETTHSSNEKAIQYVASNMIKEAPKIAITFDDGPSPAWTPKLLDVMPVMWTIDPLDWTTNNEDEIVNKVVTQAKENDIILLHDCYESSVNAALRIVDILQKEGFEFVTVDELIMN